MRARRFVALFAMFAATTSLSVGAQLIAGAASKAAPFAPMSVSFISSQQGWVLGSLACGQSGRCLTMLTTVNAGHSWFKAHLPTPLVNVINRYFDHDTSGLNVRFATPRDGWIYGEVPAMIHQSGQTYSGFKGVLWATHDGGALWQRQALPGISTPDGVVYDVETSRTTVYALATKKSDTAEVESSPVTKNKWRTASTVALNGPAGGAQPSGAMVIDGKAGWLIFGNDRGTTGSARLSAQGTWVPWRSPCAGVGHGYAVPAAANARDLVAVCGMGGFAYPMPTSAPHDATPGSSWLYLSTNGGTSFKVGAEIRPVKENASFGQFGGVLAFPRPHVILLSRNVGKGQELIESNDTGMHWSAVYSGQVSYLDFVDPIEGVGLVRLAGNAQGMIMTFDGGQHWRSVRF